MSIQVNNGFIQSDFLKYIEDVYSNVQTETGLIGDLEDSSTYTTKPNVRRSKVKLAQDPRITNHIMDHVYASNAKSYGFDLYNYTEQQYGIYDAKERGHYTWHADTPVFVDSPTQRKLSISIQLSEEDDYEGGDLEFQNIEIKQNIRKKGTLILFPSYELHRVTPVTRGVRKSLVLWVYGPRFK